MASFLDKTQVNTAITDNTKLSLNHIHISTADFMQLAVATIHELVPGSKIDVNMESFARLNPLPVPTFGRASIRNRAFFVPFRTIFRGWNDFITDAVHIASDGYSGSGTSLVGIVPTIDMAELCDVFRNSIGTTSTSNTMLYQETPPLSVFDVQIISGGTTTNCNYTVFGRQCVKLLEQLGYKLDYNAIKGDCVMSALPLLALAKIYCTYYFPQQYSNLSVYDRLMSLCNLDISSGPLQLTSSDVTVILTTCSWVCFDSSYFVSAWDQPNSPNTGNYSDFRIVNIDSVSGVFNKPVSGSANSINDVTGQGYVANTSNVTLGATNRFVGADAPFISGTVYGMYSAGNVNVTAPAPISEYLLHGLHALTDYMKRHQLAGSRAFDRYLARFGKALAPEKMDRPLYLGSHMQDINIGDVTATSDTIGANPEYGGCRLGDMSGKGISYGSGEYSFSSDEYGYFIILSSIVPATGYFQGIDRQVLRTTKTEFYTPEFESLGVQPITACELFIPQLQGHMSTGSPYTQIFGFTPRYMDYKCAHDYLTGNFRLLSLNGGSPLWNASDSWHLMRTFDGVTDFAGDWSNVVHSPDFITGGSGYNFWEFKRIFYNDEVDSPDNFTIIHNFEIAEYFPGKSAFDVYEFEDKGKKVTLETNGVKLN